MAEVKQPQSFIEALQQGGLPPMEERPVVVATPSDEEGPSAIGGLAALGATVLGATALGRRIPAIRNYFKTTPKPKIDYLPNKPVVSSNPDIPTATGQSTDLITTTGKELVAGKSKFATALNNPLNFGEPIKPGGRLFGSAAYDRALEAPFDKAPAQQWIRWFQDANRGDLTYPGGPLQGVSRRVSPEELTELNLVNFDTAQKPISGFLKTAADQNIPVDRDSILSMIKRSPINNIKTLRLTVGKDPAGEFGAIRNEVARVASKFNLPLAEPVPYLDDVYGSLRRAMNKGIVQDGDIPPSVINTFQNSILELTKAHPEQAKELSNILIQFNRTTGKYNAASAKPPAINGKQDLNNYYPKHKEQRSYHLDGGENFTEDVIFYDGPLPKVQGSKFSYSEGGPHYLKNSGRELAFVRYDDLPNPKLGAGKRHLRVSEVQSDLHSPQFSSNKDTVENYFKKKVVPFNQDANVQLLQNERSKILTKLAPYQELGRGQMGLTRPQQQELAKLKYQLNELDRNALGQLIKQGTIDATTAGPFSRSYNDMVVKNLLRSMAERRVNAISIVPASMNQNVKMFAKNKLGNEMNYGLQDGKGLARDRNGKLVKSSKYSALNESLNKIAKQYGAKFEMFPMPKSNPLKPYKIIEEITDTSSQSYRDALDEGRAIFNNKRGKTRIFENHLGAAETEAEAEMLKTAINESVSTRGTLKIVKLNADSPKNYEMVPTLVADDATLQKFLLPQKAYMYEGGLVENTDLFKSIL